MTAHASPATVLAARDKLAKELEDQLEFVSEFAQETAEWLISNGIVAQEYFDAIESSSDTESDPYATFSGIPVRGPSRTIITEPGRGIFEVSKQHNAQTDYVSGNVELGLD